MLKNQTVYLGFQQRSVNKFLVAEKLKICQIYIRVYDVKGEACFVQ